MNPEKTCCFFGHRETEETPELKTFLKNTLEFLICKHGVSSFLFGSKSKFDTLCLKVVSALKETYPHIRRIYVRSHFSHIEEDYMKYLLQFYDETFFPDKIENAGKLSYIKRNREMINSSKFCIVYYNELESLNKKSGTRLAYEYAKKKERHIINAFSSLDRNDIIIL